MTAKAKSDLIKFDVLNRLSGDVQFSAEISCAADALPSIKLGLAVKWAIKNKADLRSADLSYADLSYANLRYADLSYAKNSELAIAMTRILPDGDLVGWKKCAQGVIVKLLIPFAAKRSHAFGRKCRAEYVQVIEVIDAEVAISQHDNKTEYRAGAIIKPDSFDESWMEECSNGIHFYISRIEAENY